MELLAQLPSSCSTETGCEQPALPRHFTDPQQPFMRGTFNRITTSSLDLPSPKPPPNPRHAQLWLQRMPSHITDLLTTGLQSSFLTPLQDYVSPARIAHVQLPPPRIHGSHNGYLSLLHAADKAGMLYWEAMNPTHPTSDAYDEALQLTLFAMSKTNTRNRLISWPRIPNAVIPDPPHTSLPDPSMFDAITTQHAPLSGFYLDIHNMFHNITLTPALSKLFPLKPVPFAQLPPSLRELLPARLHTQRLQPTTLLCPYQATMPMGFKWSVFIAQEFASSCLSQAFALFKASSLAPHGLSHQVSFQREQAPFHITTQTPLLLHIIDDIVAIAAEWPSSALTAWHHYVRRIFHLNRLPVSEKKSCPVHHVEKDQVSFLGCIWDLQRNRICPSTDKLAATTTQLHSMLPAGYIPLHTWERTLGKLIWFSLLNRLLLACTQKVFHLQAAISAAQDHNPRLTASCRRELLMLTSLLPLASVSPDMPFFHTIIAFDASLQAGAVTYARISPLLAQQIWSNAKHFQFRPIDPEATEENIDEQDYRHITSLNWIKALAHSWRHRGAHINDLEASTAVLALEWAIRSGARSQRLTLITDSMVVKGFLQKGRSSSPPLLLRSRRFAALALAQQLRVALLYIPSKLNPADGYTRF